MAVGMLALMGVLMFTSSKGDALTMDEDGDIGAGYSYLRKADHRLNPEHPPLMKDLGALPLLWMNLREPWDHPSWSEEINGASAFARELIFRSGNDADAITQAARKPMILFTLALGTMIFVWTKRAFGNACAALATFFYSFSPTILAHGRLVTLDVGASAGFFVATVAFVHFLKEPAGTTILLAGLALGFALLTKFSTLSLAPVFFLLTFLGFALERPVPVESWKPALRSGWKWLRRYVAIVTAAFLSIYPVYWHHTRDYPPERQKNDTTQLLSWLSLGPMHKVANLMASRQILPQYEKPVREFPRSLIVFASDKPILRPYAMYFLGLFFIAGRTAFGNSKYFLGAVSSTGTPSYFPFVYLVKEPLAFHILTVAALSLACIAVSRVTNLRDWVRSHLTEVVFLTVTAFYWIVSIRSNLNIGVRHMLPIFPFLSILVALGVVRLCRRLGGRRYREQGCVMILAALLAWQATSVLRLHPHYLAYFNEIAGGPDGGHRYVVDSNLDWGQDLKRLAEFVGRNNITQIHLDYFGRAEPEYYLGRKYLPMSSAEAPRKGWIAVSASSYQESRREPDRDYRRWLPLSNRIATIGYSIFVFYVP